MSKFKVKMHFLAIIFIILILTMAISFPLILKITGYIPGFFSTDESYGLLWDSWRIKYSFLNRVSLTKTYLIAYPFGIKIYRAGYFSTLWLAWHHFLSICSNAIITYNIQILLNLFLSALFTYILVFYLVENYFSALISSVIFAYCPYQFARIWQHLGLSYNQWLPLVLFAVIFVREGFSKKSFLALLLSFILTFSFDWSIMYFAAMILATYFVYILFYNFKTKILDKQNYLLINDLRYFRKIFFIGIIAFVILSPQFFRLFLYKTKMSHSTIGQPSAHSPYLRSFEDLFKQSSKPLSYFLPATVHPIFGNFTERFIGSSLYGDSFTEHTLYLGWLPLMLALSAFKKWRKIKKSSVTDKREIFANKEHFYIGFFVFLAVVAWLFSQPPWWVIGPVKIYMPSYFMYKILPMYRAYCRFGVIVMLAVAVLAGFGLKFILERFRSQKTKISLTCLFLGLVLFEFWNYPPYKVIDVSRVPEVYYWVKEHPGDFVIAEYPLDADSPNELYKFFQTVHEKKIINSTIPGTEANKFAQAIVQLSSLKTAGILKGMGVKYVLVHHDGYIQTDLIEEKEELAKITQNPGLKCIKSFPAQDCPRQDIMCVQKTGPIDVYEITAKSKELEIR